MGLRPGRRKSPAGPSYGVPPACVVPGHVLTDAAPHGGMVLLDVRSGAWYAMNGTAAALFQRWRGGGDFDAAVRETARAHPGTDPERVRRDAVRLAGELLARGLVRGGAVPVPVGAGRVRGGVGAGPVPREPGSGREPDPGPGPVTRDPGRGSAATAVVRCLGTVAFIGLAAALVLRRLPFRAAPALVRAVKRLRARRPANAGQAQAVLVAVRSAGLRFPGRVACLEESLAAVLALALAGLAADLSVGYVPDPYRFHARIEVAGSGVAHPDDARDLEPFRRVLTV